MSEDEPEIRIDHREALAYLLAEASEIEHGLMDCYLYAAWSLGPRGVDRPHADAIERWRRELISIARDEMVHLALVANLTNAIGATPHFQRANFPVSPGYHPSGVTVSLAPFCPATIDHFVYLERPEGVDERDGEGFVGKHYQRHTGDGRLVPGAADYQTVGHLYRGIERGLEALAAKLGEENLFDGDPRLQLTSSIIGLPGVTAITDLASAKAALEAIVEQGEGASDHTETSHYARFCAVRDELRAIREQDPTFEAAPHVAANPVMRKPATETGVLWIDAEPAASIVDVGNALYAFMLRSLGALFSPVSLAPGARSLSVAATTLAMRTLSPIAELLTTLPASTTHDGVTAGLTFTMSRSITPMPEPRGAFRALAEGARGIVDGMRTHIVPRDASFAPAAASLEVLANELAALADAAPAPSFDGASTVATTVAAARKAPLEYTSGAIETARGESVLLRFEAKRCIHSRHCVLDAPTVFLANVKGPWLYPDTVDAEYLAHVARTCPSGAITYERLDGGPAEKAPEVNQLRLRENGPYAIHADVNLVGSGKLQRATLCRCGASANKPFCDGSHNVIEFQATGEPATRTSQPLAIRGGEIEVRPTDNGPLQLTGNLEICTGTGRTVDRVTSARLCRCGGSATKPFCDGTHAKIGFRSDI
jgi:CDGSH-type Zn-finger protein/uncharacterized Fe-S cluster protein YjdI